MSFLDYLDLRDVTQSQVVKAIAKDYTVMKPQGVSWMHLRLRDTHRKDAMKYPDADERRAYNKAAEWKAGDRGYVVVSPDNDTMLSEGDIVTVTGVDGIGHPLIGSRGLIASGEAYHLLRFQRGGETLPDGTEIRGIVVDGGLGAVYPWGTYRPKAVTGLERVITAFPEPEETPDQKRLRLLTEAARKAQADLEAALKEVSS